jgi:drug/metabolite transporter (DMT)-like permease
MIEQAAIPFIIFIGNFILFRTRATGSQLIGFALTFIGVLITAMHGDITRMMTLQFNQGDAMMLLAVILFGGYSVCLKWKPVMHWQSQLAIPCIGILLIRLAGRTPRAGAWSSMPRFLSPWFQQPPI